MKHRRTILAILLLSLVFLVAGCFGSTEAQPEEEIIRTPRPTFTPTPAPPTATPAPAVTTPAEQPGAASSSSQTGDTLEIAADAPIAVVNSDLVNARQRPEISSEGVIKELNRGTELRIVGKTADDEWWYVCCVDEGTAWIYYSYVDTSGNVDAVPVSDGVGGPVNVAEAAGQTAAGAAPTQPPAAAPTPVPPPVAPPAVEQPSPTSPPAAPPPAEPTAVPPPTETPAPTEPPAPQFPFNLVAQEQFMESNNLVRIFLYVYQGNTALPGYTLRVLKDGAELPVSAQSIDAAGFTWPVADPRQRFQNMKVEFPNVQSAGTWEVQLIDSGGAPAGPVATFTLAGGDLNRELYVRYEKP